MKGSQLLIRSINVDHVERTCSLCRSRFFGMKFQSDGLVGIEAMITVRWQLHKIYITKIKELYISTSWIGRCASMDWICL